MNAGGHIAIAMGVGHGSTATRPDEGVQSPTAGFLLGAALPDLSTMGGYRMLGSTPDDDVRRGIALHHRSDDAFHRHPWFTGHNRALTDVLSAAGLGRGPARACAHVGIELLLDGELLDDAAVATATATAFDAIEPRLDRLATLVRTGDVAGWRRHLSRIAQLRLPDDYGDPIAVAERLHRILRRRPRLAFETAHVATVALALREVQPVIARTAAELVVDLQTTLRSSPAAANRPSP